jgi:hypothetical protein
LDVDAITNAEHVLDEIPRRLQGLKAELLEIKQEIKQASLELDEVEFYKEAFKALEDMGTSFRKWKEHHREDV